MIPWRRKWQPTPVFCPGKSHGQRNLVGYSPWDQKSRTWLKKLSSSSSSRTVGVRGLFWNQMIIFPSVFVLYWYTESMPFSGYSLVAQTLKYLPTMWVGLGLIRGSGRSPGEGNGNPLQYSCLENPMGGGDWQAIVHGVAKSLTRLSNFTSLHFMPFSSIIFYTG